MPLLRPGSQTSLGRPVASWDLWGWWCWWRGFLCFCFIIIPREFRAGKEMLSVWVSHTQPGFSVAKLKVWGFLKIFRQNRCDPRGFVGFGVLFFHQIPPFDSSGSSIRAPSIHFLQKFKKNQDWNLQKDLVAVCLPSLGVERWNILMFLWITSSFSVFCLLCFVLQVFQEKKRRKPLERWGHHGVRGVGMWLKIQYSIHATEDWGRKKQKKGKISCTSAWIELRMLNTKTLPAGRNLEQGLGISRWKSRILEELEDPRGGFHRGVGGWLWAGCCCAPCGFGGAGWPPRRGTASSPASPSSSGCARTCPTTPPSCPTSSTTTTSKQQLWPWR